MCLAQFENDMTTLLLYSPPANRNSFNVLLGALETDPHFDDWEIYVATRPEELGRQLEEGVARHSMPIVAVSFFTTQLWDTADLLKDLRAKWGNRFVCLAGGPHPTGDPAGTLGLGADFAVVGEGEETFPDLLKAIECGGEMADVKGIAYLDEKRELRHTGRRPAVDLDKYPPFAVKRGRFGPIEITRGCPFGCYFCQTSRIFGGRPRHRSPEKICHYVELLLQNDIRDIRFISPNAFAYGSADGKTLELSGLERLFRDLRRIAGPHGKLFLGTFPSEVRPEDVTEDTIALVLKYADNDNLTIGGQSGSQRMLDSCHRDHTVTDIYQAVRRTVNAGLTANVDFIFGLPDETREDIDLTLKVIGDLIEIGAKIHAHTFIPLPQTPFAGKNCPDLGSDLKKTVGKWIGTGSLFGNWEKQADLAARIQRYLKTGELFDAGHTE